MFRVGILFSVFLLMGSLSMRSSYFYNMFFIVSVTKVFADKKANLLLRFTIVSLALLTSLYSMYIVWMGSPWWDHAVYHSLLGDW